MRQILVKYEGDCRKCNNALPVGQVAIYEKHVGLFCLACEPKDPEEIRAYRQEAADKRADKYEDWATKRRAQAGAVLEHDKIYNGDHAFNTQPGHIPLRARVIARDDRAIESLQTAKRFEDKAEQLRHVRVKGDADRKYQAISDALDKVLAKGSRIFDVVFGEGEIVGVFKKSYRIKWDRSGRTWAREKFYVRPMKAETPQINEPATA